MCRVTLLNYLHMEASGGLFSNRFKIANSGASFKIDLFSSFELYVKQVPTLIDFNLGARKCHFQLEIK
jgi:hypothetical protein